MDSHLAGEAAAVSVSLFWSFCTLFFAFSSRRVGSLSVNALRIAMAVVLLGIAHVILFSTLVPQATGGQWLYMGISGFIGLALGDFLYFGSLVILGPRRGVLVMATSPIFSATLGFVFLGEVLSSWIIVGIAVTLCGVLWVILESEEKSEEKKLDRRTKTWGVLLGIGGSAGQGIGLVLSKYGMLHAGGADLNPLSATLIRLIVATISFWIIILVMNRYTEVFAAFKDRKAMGAVFGGAILGPFLGVWLSMVALTYTMTGVAATLMSLMPVMIIPIVWAAYRQKTSWRGIAGACVTILGIAILFLA